MLLDGVREGNRVGRRIALLTVLALPLSASAQDAAEPVEYPLDPPDLSSPESTLDTFLTEAAEAIEAYRAGDREEMELHASRTFQTMEMPLPDGDAAFMRAAESTLYLFEILSRVPLPPARQIPGPRLSPEEMPRQWTIPHTELVLERFDSESGEPLGYRFSAETIARVPEFYERAAELPVKQRYAKYAGAADSFRLRPGFDAPRLLQSAVQSLPPTGFKLVGGEPLWKWVAIVLAMLGGFLSAFVVFRIASPLDDGGSRVSGPFALVRPLLVTAAIAIIAFVRHVTVDWIRLTGAEREVVLGLLSVLTHAAFVWLAFLLLARFANAIIHVREMGVYALDAQLVRLVSKLIAVLVTIYILIHLAESLGIPVAPVLAGLGVGGLAVALAVRPTLENIIGGFVLFADAPVRVGEFCQFGDQLGTVEAIGLRSVRIRGLNRTVITVPNADFSQLQLINFSRRDMNLFLHKLQLRFETSPDQLRLVLARLRELLMAHPKVSPDPARVRFVGYGESSLEVELFAFIETRDWNEFLAIQEDLNLRVKDVVKSSGTDFAFPSQTVYLQQSEGLDAGLTKGAEEEVARWRAENRLPFPDHDEGAWGELSGTLDYPPEGSATGRNE